VSPLLDFPAPTSTAILQIAGITVEKQSKEVNLKQEWKQLADKSVNGFILITFGSIAKTSEMPSLMWKTLEESFLKFSQINFIIKHEKCKGLIEQWRENVYFTRWIPQVELMCKY
jgi:hypothetical protein